MPKRKFVTIVVVLCCCFTVDTTLETNQQSTTHTVDRIADINNELVDDGLVDKAKIGGSNYFWSFPAKKHRLMQIKYEKMLETIETTKVRVEEAKARLADAKRGREDDDGERSQKLARLSELATEKAKLETELESLKENDPQAIADLQKELKFVTEAANRWTDNIFNCKTYLVKKRGLEKKEANKYLGITEIFDCTSFFVC